MSSTDRQNRLLLAEDWEKVYQSFRNAEFRSYDFDTLRRVMISYIRNNYPEDFNDYIETSEFLALIDLIAFLGQNISYRVDMNARENYLELAERRESVLRLARLLSYNARRNQAANGLLKFDTVSTTESIVDSNGTNLSGQTIIWNDPSNANWAEQFRRVLNASLPRNNTIGKPRISTTINGVLTQTYKFNQTTDDVPVFVGFIRAAYGSADPGCKFELRCIENRQLVQRLRAGNDQCIGQFRRALLVGLYAPAPLFRLERRFSSIETDTDVRIGAQGLT